jgi:hypothetical protein
MRSQPPLWRVTILMASTSNAAVKLLLEYQSENLENCSYLLLERRDVW